MACYQRERTGSCGCSACPHPDESGYECIEIIGGLCECGDGCVEQCRYSWPADDKATTARAAKAIQDKYGERAI